MGGLRQNLGSARIAISVIAAYALLFHGFFASAAHTGAADPAGWPLCTQSPAGTPATNGAGHHGGLCCLLGCAACGCAYLSQEAGGPAVVVRFASLLAAWLPAPPHARYEPLKFSPGARGPPVSL